MDNSIFKLNATQINKFQSKSQNPWNQNYCYSSLKRKFNLENETKDLTQENSQIPSRSHKNNSNLLQTSFQSDFLHEHAKVFEMGLWKFIESIASCSQKIKIHELKKRILYQKLQQTCNWYSTLKSSLCDIENKEKVQFWVDLGKEKKFQQFLDFICKMVLPEICCQLYRIANFVWIEYLKLSPNILSQKNLKIWAQNLSQKGFTKYKSMMERTEQICFEQDPDKSFPNFQIGIKSFMKQYFVTIVLTVEQYFENPFYVDNQKQQTTFKRYFNEEDHYSSDQCSDLEINFKAHKKRNVR